MRNRVVSIPARITTPLSPAQLQALWVEAGGPRAAAPLMAAIAIAESGGRPWALNNTPATGDYSTGLWQINYYGNLLGPRTARYGPPASLYGYTRVAALRNARAAVNLYAGGRGLSNWEGDAAYKAYTDAGGGRAGIAALSPFIGAYSSRGEALVSTFGPGQSRPRPGGSSVVDAITGWFSNAGSGAVGDLKTAASPFVNSYESAASLVTDTTDFLKFAVWLVTKDTWLRIFEVVTGFVLIGLSLRGLVIVLASRDAPGGLEFHTLGGAARSLHQRKTQPAADKLVPGNAGRRQRRRGRAETKTKTKARAARLARFGEIPFE